METNRIILICIFSILVGTLYITNSWMIKKDKTHGWVDLGITSGIIVVFVLFVLECDKCKQGYQYTLSGWNPDSYRNAYLGNDLVSGTVYAEDPENDPGLGWVL